MVFLFLKLAIQNDGFRSVTHTLMLSSDEKPILSLCDLHGARTLLVVVDHVLSAHGQTQRTTARKDNELDRIGHPLHTSHTFFKGREHT